MRGLPMAGWDALNVSMLVRFQLPQLSGSVGKRKTTLVQNQGCCGFESHLSHWARYANWQSGQVESLAILWVRLPPWSYEQQISHGTTHGAVLRRAKPERIPARAIEICAASGLDRFHMALPLGRYSGGRQPERIPARAIEICAVGRFSVPWSNG